MRRRCDEKIIRAIACGIDERNGYAIISKLCDIGLLDRVNAERFYMVGEVERRVRNGELKKRAIELVAMEMCCSFEKVRAAVYAKR